MASAGVDEATPICRAVVSAADRAQAAKVLGVAMADCETSCYIFRNPRVRHRALRWFYAVRLSISAAMGATTLGLFHPTSGACVSTATLGPISAQTPPLWVRFWNGLLFWPFLWGFPSMLRAVALGKEATLGSTAANGACAFDLMMVGTAPEHQGRGHMSRLLKEALAPLAARGVTVGLSTQTEKNVRLYQKAGFVLTGQKPMFEGTADSFPSWYMKLGGS